LLCRLWILALLAAAVSPAGAVTVAARTATPNGSTYFGGPNGLFSLYVSWTQTATFSGPMTFGGTFHCVGCSGSQTASATLYLTNSIGPGITAANILGSTPFTVSSTTPTPLSVTMNIALPPATYYLIVGGMSSNFAWDRDPTAVTTPCSGDEQCASGVTINPDGNDNIATPPPNPPASSTWNFFPTSPARSLLFSVTLNPAGVPALSLRWLGGTAALLLAAGLWLTRRIGLSPAA